MPEPAALVAGGRTAADPLLAAGSIVVLLSLPAFAANLIRGPGRSSMARPAGRWNSPPGFALPPGGNRRRVV